MLDVRKLRSQCNKDDCMQDCMLALRHQDLRLHRVSKTYQEYFTEVPADD